MTEMGGHGPLEGPPRDRYLERLETHLRMPPEAAWDVLDEVEAHIADAIAAGIDEGLTPGAAERRALDRLGPPDVLGKDLRRTHQTRRRLLAAVGGGAWQAARGAVRGYLGGTVVMIGILLGATFLIAVAAIVARGFRVDIPISLGQVLIYGPLWGAIGVAGREMTTAISDRSLRSIESIRLPIASLGGGVVAAFVWFVPADHTRLTIALALATPLVFVSSAWTADREIGPWIFGERWETLGPKLRRRLFRTFIGTVIAALLTSFVVFALGWPSSAGTTVIEGDRPLLTPLERWRAAGYDVVAPRVVGSRVLSLAESYPEDGFVVARVPDDLVDWDGWRRLRFEVWPATDPFGAHQATIVGDRPMAVTPVEDPWARIGHSIRVGYPDADGFLLFLIAEDPSTGERVAFGQPTDGPSMFHGSLIDWFQPR